MIAALFLFLQISNVPGVSVQDEGTLQCRAQTFNFTGAGINATCSGGVATVNASGGAGSFTAKETEIDWATCGQGLINGIASYNCKATIADVDVSTSSKIITTQSAKAATGKSEDENEMDSLICKAAPASGQFTLYCTSEDGMATGKYLINYAIG